MTEMFLYIKPVTKNVSFIPLMFIFVNEENAFE